MLTRQYIRICSSTTSAFIHCRKMSQNINDSGDNVNEQVGSLSRRAKRKLARVHKWKQSDKKPKRKDENAPKPGFAADLYKETDYYFENGLRKIYPYYYTFTTYVKRRWIGRTIFDVFCSEFKANTPDDYRKAIETGTLTADGEKVSMDFLLKDGMFIGHTLHRHENPVIGCSIEVLANTDDLIVINKPSSIPCHPCGQYRHNSIVFIIGQQLGCANLRNIYRLDRLTSGVLILGKTSKQTKILEDQVLNRQVQKEYVSRVVGEFPDGVIECKQPLGIISQKLGLFRVREDGKQSHTTFEKISFNGKSSVVRCTPHTGRTHQIRVHLQYLGYPIVNDPFYNSEAWGPNKNKGGVMDRTDQEVSDRMLELHNIGHWTDGLNPLFEERLKEIENEKDNNKKTPISDNEDNCGCSTDKKTSSDSMVEPGDGDLATDVKPTDVADQLGRTHGDPPAKKIKLIHNVPNRIGDDSVTVTVPKKIGDDSVTVSNASGDDSVVATGSNKVGDDSVTVPNKSGDDSVTVPNASSDDSVTVPNANADDSVAVIDLSEVGGDVNDVRTDLQLKVFDRRKWVPDPKCDRCRLKYVDPKTSDLVMYLHALKYSGPGWAYSTALPEWAKDDWIDEDL